jgi:hypothetical protein
VKERQVVGFNPDAVAYAEAEGWRAYYDRRWVRLLSLMVALCQYQFRIPFPLSLLAAYYVIRASAEWVPIHHDARMVRWFLERFYRLARRYSGLPFDPARAADLELRYFAVHRRDTANPDKSALIDALTDLHAELLQLPPERVRESAAYRVQAAVLVDGITSHTSRDVEGDWARLEELLRQCYRSMSRELEKPRA